MSISCWAFSTSALQLALFTEHVSLPEGQLTARHAIAQRLWRLLNFCLNRYAAQQNRLLETIIFLHRSLIDCTHDVQPLGDFPENGELPVHLRHGGGGE